MFGSDFHKLKCLLTNSKNKSIGKRKEYPKVTSITKGNTYLLAIGINTYHHFTTLHNAVKDIEDLTYLLITEFGFFGQAPFFKILKDEEATRKNIIGELKQLCILAKPEDRVLIYYSGHGHVDMDTKRGFWIPVEGEKNDDAGYVANTDVRDYIKAMISRHILLISDSCFSASLLVRGENVVTNDAFSDWESTNSRWLFCSGKDVVLDGEKGKNSPFAEGIIRHLSNPAVNRINISRLADDVIRSVSFNYRQQAEASPLFDAGHKGGQFIFYRVTGEDEEDVIFENVRNSKKKDALIDFLRISANKEYKKEIRKILKMLEKGDRAWKAVNQTSYAALDEFVDEYPDHPIVKEAKIILAKLHGKQLVQPVSHLIKDPNTFTDPRDGQVYKTAKLKDGHTWLAQNLNFDVGKGCWFYNDDPKNGQKYGRLYIWESAVYACPSDWRLPTDEEWWTLSSYYGKAFNSWSGQSKNEERNAGKAAFKDLIDGGSSGLAIQLGGGRYSDGTFYDFGDWGDYWSSTKYSSDGVWSYRFYGPDSYLSRNGHDNSWGFSCRCIRKT